MNESKECIVSVAFREPYLRHSANQERAIKMLCPEVDLIYFRDELPTKDGIIKGDINKIVSHFQSSLYGFKPHAIKYAYDLGYKRIMWLDPSVFPMTPISSLLNHMSGSDHRMTAKIGDHDLDSMVNNRALEFFQVSRFELQRQRIKHIGGAIYGFDFWSDTQEKIFNRWLAAEEAGIFGTQDDFMKGHWADESCLALSAYIHGRSFYLPPDFKYLNQKEM